jgi:hypothetical protein
MLTIVTLNQYFPHIPYVASKKWVVGALLREWTLKIFTEEFHSDAKFQIIDFWS